MRSVFFSRDPAATHAALLRQPVLVRNLSTWLPVVIGLCIIAGESTVIMGSGHTSQLLRPYFEALLGHLTEERWSALHHILRKSGHFFGYGTMGLLWLRASLRTLAHPTLLLATWLRRGFLIATLCLFLTASADEYHQTFLPGRTGQFSDVLLDTAGALLFFSIVGLLRIRFAQAPRLQ